MSGAALAAAMLKLTPLVVTLSAGSTVSFHGTTSADHDFGTNTATISGGSGSYSYSWSSSNGGANGTWALSNPLAAATDVSVTGVTGTSSTNATCLVTDVVTGRTGSATTHYTYTNNL